MPSAWGISLTHVLLLAVILRVALVLWAAGLAGHASVFHAFDTASYLLPARELLATGRFSVNGTPELVRTPGYPLFLIPGILLGSVEVVTIALQAALSCLTVWVVYHMGRLLFRSERAGARSALLYASEPISIFYASMLLSETLFTACIALFSWQFLAYLESRDSRPLLFAGLALGASAYVRPLTSLFFPLLMAACAALIFRRQGVLKRATLKHLAGFLLGCLMATGAWQARNLLAAGYPGISAIGDDTLYFFHAAGVIAAEQALPLASVQQQLGLHNQRVFLERNPELKMRTAAERYLAKRREAARIIRSQPTLYAVIYTKGLAKVVLDSGWSDYVRLLKAGPWAVPVIRTLLDTVLGVYLLLCIAGIVAARPISAGPALAILVVAAYLLLLSGGPAGYGRFRHPVMPVVCVFAGYGWLWTACRLRTTASAAAARV